VELSRGHQQVLAFVGAYLRGYQCLPTAAEVARASGLRSTRTAGRLLKDLEDAGLLERDARYSRLGHLRTAGRVTPVSEYDQLWLCELGCVELTSNLEALRIALDFSIPASTIAAIHSEGVSRAVELQAYEDVRTHLTDAGIKLSEDDRAALEEQRRLTHLAHQLLTDWDAYCIVRLVWTLSAWEWLSEVDPLPFGYVGTCLVVSHRTYTALLPTYREQAAGPLSDDERAPMLLSRLADLLTAFRQVMAAHTPVQQPRADLDISELLAL
jgi:SOS-response transcriptional repressor LexA